MTKKFYDNDAIKRIEKMRVKRNHSQAFKEIQEYLLKYPNDTYAHIMNACVLLDLEKFEEALVEIESCLDAPLHGYNDECSLYTTYGAILLKLGREEEGLENLFKAIELTKKIKGHETGHAQNIIIKHYLEKRQLKKAISFAESCKNTPQLLIKKANIYLLDDNIYKALEELNKVRVDALESELLKGHYYFLQGKIAYFLKDYSSAFEYLEKCTKIESDWSKKALSYLGHLEIDRMNPNQAIKYGLELVNGSVYTSHGYELLARAYTSINSFEQAEEVINKMDNYYWKTFRAARLAYAKKEYAKAEELFSKLLHCNVTKRFEENLEYYILCLFRQHKFDEAIYAMDCVQSVGEKETHDMDMIRIYCDSLKHKPILKSKLSYSGKQVYEYSRDEAIHHIISHHVIDSRLSQFNDADIRKIYDEVYKKLQIKNNIPDLYFDKQILYFHDIGVSIPNYENDQKEIINQLEVVLLPETKDILTMYPRKGTDAYLDEKEDESPSKPKRLSQIDKFNKRYGKM